MRLVQVLHIPGLVVRECWLGGEGLRELREVLGCYGAKGTRAIELHSHLYISFNFR